MHALRTRRSTLTDRSALWLTFPPRYTNSFVWLLYTWPAASTLNVAVDSSIPFGCKHMISVLASNTVRPNAAHTTTITPIIFFNCSSDCETTPASSVYSIPQNGVARTNSQKVASPRPPASLFFLSQVYQSVYDAFVRLETRGGQVCNRREEYVEQEGYEHLPLTKTLFHSEPPRAHPVVESHACSHTIVEMTNDRNNNLWHAKTGEYCPEKGSINGVVRFGKVDKAYIERGSFLPRQLL